MCKLETEICNCVKNCKDCNKPIPRFLTEYNLNIAFCTCDKAYIESLRTKLISDHGLEITEAEQTDISEIVDASLEKYNLEPSAIRT